MRPPRLFIVLAVFLSCVTAQATSRLTFQRIIAAPHDLGGAQDLAVVYAIGDNAKITTFLDVFIDQTSRSGTLRVHDATAVGRTIGIRPDDAALKRFRRRFGAQLYLRVNAFSCKSNRKSGEGSSYDFEGKRVRRKQLWIDASCAAHIDVLDPDSLRTLSFFDAHGEGTSPRVEELTDEERDTAIDQAARYAAVAAAEEITPRRVRETITLDETAPAFEDGMAMIDADRLAEARNIWDQAVSRGKDSAALHFNLAAVCEALGDLVAAQQHYQEARRLAPKESRYRIEAELFRRRNRLK